MANTDFSKRLDQLSRALAPAVPPTTSFDAEFDRLLFRFKREWMFARRTGVWRSTFAEIVELSKSLFVDKGDLVDFFALDHAGDLVAALRIDGFEDVRDCLKHGGPPPTLASIVDLYVACPSNNHVSQRTLWRWLQQLVIAYSPDTISELEIAELVVEILIRARARLSESDPALADLARLRYEDRAERYRQAKEAADTRRKPTAGST